MKLGMERREKGLEGFGLGEAASLADFLKIGELGIY